MKPPVIISIAYERKPLSGVQCYSEERNGFFKNVCYDKNSRNVTHLKCLNTDETYEEDFILEFLYFKGHVCSKDPLFYQACDKRFNIKITNNQVMLCGESLCKWPTQSIITLTVIKTGGYLCDGKISCLNGGIDEVGCKSDEKVTMLSGKSTLKSNICDDKCDSVTCEDEANCNGYTYGAYCKSSTSNSLDYRTPGLICDECGIDCKITNNTKNVCKAAFSNRIVPVYNFTRCNTVSLSTYSQNFLKLEYP